MTFRIAAAFAVLALFTTGCTRPTGPARPAVNDKVYAVTPGAITVKAGVLTGALTDMKIVERVEEGSGRVDQPARLVGNLVVTNVSKDQSLRLLGAKLLYIDLQGKPIPLEDRRTEPTVKVASSYGGQDRLDPGQETSQPVEAEFPIEGLKAKRLKEIRLELLYIPSSYKHETMNFGVSIGG
jgi:hypothetical protein